MTHAQWVAEINKRLQAESRFSTGMKYVSIESVEGKPIGTTWFDPAGNDLNRDLFLRISEQMCRDRPLIED